MGNWAHSQYWCAHPNMIILNIQAYKRYQTFCHLFAFMWVHFETTNSPHYRQSPTLMHICIFLLSFSRSKPSTCTHKCHSGTENDDIRWFFTSINSHLITIDYFYLKRKKWFLITIQLSLREKKHCIIIRNLVNYS